MSEPILSPEQVVWYAREMGWVLRPPDPPASIATEMRNWISGGDPWQPIYDQRDPCFLLPLETYLMQHGWTPFRLWSGSHAHAWGMLLGVAPGQIPYRPEITYKEKIEGDSHEDAILHAASDHWEARAGHAPRRPR